MPISLCTFSLTLHRNLENTECSWELGVNQVLLKGLGRVDSQNSPLLMDLGWEDQTLLLGRLLMSGDE